MYPKLNKRYFLLLTLILYIPCSLCQNGSEYETCRAPFQCGNILNITYPFWSATRPSYCGTGGFRLDCRAEVPILNISSMQYRVLEIDNDRNTLRVARQDLSNTVCSTFLYNTTLDINLFRPSNEDRRMTLYYGCSPGQRIHYRFTCNVNNTSTESFYVIGDTPTGSGSNITCGNNIYVPINQTAAATLQALSNSTVPSVSLRQVFTANQMAPVTVGAPSNSNVTSVSIPRGVFARGFSMQWGADNRIRENCVNSGGIWGTSRDSNSFACYCANGTYASTCNNSQSQHDTSAAGRSIPTLILITAVVLFSAILFFCIRRKWWLKLKGRTQIHKDREHFLEKHGNIALRRYKYSDLKKITNSFSNKLGEGGFACVYKGNLPEGSVVAVKILKESKGNGEEFVNEIASISRTSHINVVSLLGFCFEGSKRALIYEFMSNGSLEKFIYSNSSLAKHQLGWEKKFQIVVGIARGIEYLHQGCNMRILHFDIKPHNILLDKDFNPKISDFGLAKLCPNRSSIVSILGARGTIGYIAPELVCRNIGEVFHKSDVYSYGMMVLEMVGERKNVDVGVECTSEIYFPHWIYRHLEQNVELNPSGVSDEDEQLIVRKMIIVGLWCIQTDPTIRPPMTKVVEMLEGNMESLQIPPKPYLSSPPRQEQTSSTSELALTSLL